MVSTVRVNANHGRDFSPLADHMTKLNNFTMAKNLDFLAFRFSLHLMLEQFNSLSDDFTKSTYKSCTNELACCSGY